MIRSLREGDAGAYRAIRRESLLAAPLAFASSPDEDFASDPEVLRSHLRGSPDKVIFRAFVNSLVGALGLFRDPHQKSAHKAHLWGMYVQPTHRGQGLGSELLEATLRHARSLPGISWLHLSVTAAAPEARTSMSLPASAPGGPSLTHSSTEASQSRKSTWPCPSTRTTHDRRPCRDPSERSRRSASPRQPNSGTDGASPHAGR
ncbi:MAG: GNAT family N-acetyltransferase [Deltaproteobacteria bacterium]|nr:GNAT family N-acetyltransferase [Deltaproteobacteria bacterium]MBW2420796.1 GNAT family N-acetyltransferase [Deltaproteobacteria bacterium]